MSKATPYSFCWNDPLTLERRAVELVRSMASVKCKNKFPVGVIGAQARAHYTEAHRIASGMEAPSGGETAQTGSTEGDSPTAESGDAR